MNLGFSQTKTLYNQSTDAYKNKDYVLFLKLTKQLDSIRPSHPTFTYNLASAYALNKMNTRALTILNQLLLMNNTVAFEDDTDFDNIKNLVEFKKLKTLKIEQNTLIESSNQKLTLSEKDLHPEGLLYLDKHKLWLVSSIRNKKIVSFDETGNCSDWFINTPYSVFALKADKNQNYLWVSCSAMPEMKGFTKEMEGKNEILKIDIKTKKVIKRFTIEGNHVFGDLAIAKNGDVYISDSVEPHIYKIANNQISLWKVLKGEAFNLQGIAFNNEESKLFIADYFTGIIVISMNNAVPFSRLILPEGTSKKGIDGLAYYDNALFAIQNGTVPIRILKFQLNISNTQITNFTVLDNNRSVFNEPALATISNGKMYFFANSPWKFYDKNFQLDETKIEYPKLFELKLK
jgi:hypothetical protein